MTNVELRAEIETELHDLCQPLTNVSCHLELGQMANDVESLRASINGALAECRRTFEHVEHMRRRLNERLDQTVERP